MMKHGVRSGNYAISSPPRGLSSMRRSTARRVAARTTAPIFRRLNPPSMVSTRSGQPMDRSTTAPWTRCMPAGHAKSPRLGTLSSTAHVRTCEDRERCVSQRHLASGVGNQPTVVCRLDQVIRASLLIGDRVRTSSARRLRFFGPDLLSGRRILLIRFLPGVGRRQASVASPLLTSPVTAVGPVPAGLVVRSSVVGPPVAIRFAPG